MSTTNKRIFTDESLSTLVDNIKSGDDKTLSSAKEYSDSIKTDLVDGGITVSHATTADTASAVAWSNVTGKPSTYTPSSHNHDDRYYTETEIDTKLDAKLDKTEASTTYSTIDHTHSEYLTELPTDPTFHSVRINKPEYEEALVIQDPNNENIKTILQSNNIDVYYDSGRVFLDPESPNVHIEWGESFTNYGLNSISKKVEETLFEILLPNKSGTLVTLQDFQSTSTSNGFYLKDSDYPEIRSDDLSVFVTSDGSIGDWFYFPELSGVEENRYLVTEDRLTDLLTDPSFNSVTINGGNLEFYDYDMGILFGGSQSKIYDDSDRLVFNVPSGTMILKIGDDGEEKQLATLDDISESGTKIEIITWEDDD